MSETIKYRPWAAGAPGDTLAEDDGTPGAWRCKLNHTEIFTVVEVSVEPPPEPPVELLRTVHIRDGDHDDLELHIHFAATALQAAFSLRT